MRHIILVLILAYAGTAQAVTIREMMDDDRYWPPPCTQTACVLTGLGGIVSVWEDHIDKHQGRQFIVRGVCASACEIAFQRAVRRYERVRVELGARLIKHRPSKAIWKL